MYGPGATGPTWAGEGQGIQREAFEVELDGGTTQAVYATLWAAVRKLTKHNSPNRRPVPPYDRLPFSKPPRVTGHLKAMLIALSMYLG